MPNVCSEALCIFKKMLKPPFFKFKRLTLSQSLLGMTPISKENTWKKCSEKVTVIIALLKKCSEKVTVIIALLTALALTIHHKKSVLEQTQSIKFLGFIIDQRSMTVKMNSDKSASIIKKIRDFLDNPRSTITDLASVMVRLFIYFELCLLENYITDGNFSGKSPKLNTEAQQELNWWIHHIPIASRNITVSE